MIRTQIQLEEKQYRILQEMAGAYNVSMANIIRQSVDLWIERETHLKPNREKLVEQALSVVGIAEDTENLTDISINHDKYFDEAYDYFTESLYPKGAENDID